MAKGSDSEALLQEKREFANKVAREMIPQVALRLLRDGDVSTEGKTSSQIKADVKTYLVDAIANKKIRFSIGIDHTYELLPEARRLLREGRNELSAVYFATYFEHRLNWLIFQICDSKGISGAATKQLLRDTSVRAKCTWVMALLGHPPFSRERLRAVEEINEVRNTFIHYKWPTYEGSPQEYSKSSEQISAKLKKAESLVRYLRKFEEDQLYKRQGRNLRKALKGVDRKQRP